MRIAAIYIPEGSLPHVFGEKHQGITINLGGKNLYKISQGEMKSEPNSFFIDDIFSKDISLLSAIVGNNGGGKTTLLRNIMEDNLCSYVLEEENKMPRLVDFLPDFHRVYYTPYPYNFVQRPIRKNGKDLSEFNLLISDNHGDSDPLTYFLATHESERLKRWIKFNKFFRQLPAHSPAHSVKLPKFKMLSLRLEHFDFSIHSQESFRDTSYQLRPALQLILKKIEQESEQQQINGEAAGKEDDGEKKKINSAIRFKYRLYETALGKLVSLFERAGNIYLQEGTIPEDYESQLNNLNVHEALIWFLNNGGVYIGERNYYFSNHLLIIDLINYILPLIDSSKMMGNWRELLISEDEALQIIELYNQFNQSFINEWFKFDSTPMFSIEPPFSISTGERAFLGLFSTLYNHAENIKIGIDIDGYNDDFSKDIKEDILFLLDEGDNAFHPQWKKEYVKYLREMLPLIFPEYKIQVIITSHDPLTLSDLPKNNVIYLEKVDGVTQLANSEQKRTLGANISDLLKDSFFITDGQIGGFIAQVIDKVIIDLRSNQLSYGRKEEIKRVIHAIDEPVLKFKLAEMFTEALGEREFENNLIDEEISRLEKRKRRI